MPEPFEPGDVLIDYRHGSGAHSLIWVGVNGPVGNDGKARPLVHNVGYMTVYGVLLQSTSYFKSYIEKDQLNKLLVFRCDDQAIAAKAATLALGWAESTGKTGNTLLRSPYSDRRLNEAMEVFGQEIPWTPGALFRAIKAVARSNDNLPLSPRNGFSCSQLVTLCYQAAALELKFGKAFPPEVLQGLIQAIKLETPLNVEFSVYDWSVKGHGPNSLTPTVNDPDMRNKKPFKNFKQWSKDSPEEVETILGKYVEFAMNSLPKAMRVDAKLTNADRLYEDMNKEDSNFTRKGHVCMAEEFPIGFGIQA